MSSRQRKLNYQSTALDAVIVAVSPALIIGMVSCLVFFLVVAFYRGQYDQRLIYILFLYTLATVLIARIAIENGRGYSMAFSVPLAIATMLAMLKFVTVSGVLAPVGWLINMLLLAVAWYLSDRITFDCTLLDDRETGVQQGLLQSLGLIRKESVNTNPSPPTRTKPSKTNETRRGKATSTRKKKHNPGVWVLYFSLLAFPLFGFGQLVIPNEEGRQRAFFYLVGYLACALGLLVTTSFVSMRRYLRHRGVAMPADMSRSWLGYGAFGIFVVLVVCMLLPLPGRSLGLVGLPFEFGSPDGLEANRGGWGNEGIENAENQDAATTTVDDAENDGNEVSPEGKGTPQASDSANSDGPKVASESGDKADQSNPSNKGDSQSSQKSESGNDDSPNNDSNDQRRSDGESSKPDSEGNEGSGERDQSDDGNGTNDESTTRDKENDESNEQDSEGRETDPSQAQNSDNEQGRPNSSDEREDSRKNAEEERSRTNAPKPKPAWTSSLPQSVATLIKWLTILLLACVVIVYAVTHPSEIANMWREFLRLIRNLLGGTSQKTSDSEREAEAEIAKTPRRRPFSSYANPFSGSGSWSPERIIEHTFSAMEAWAAERGVARGSEQTAVEFARNLASKAPAVRMHAFNAAKMLDELMFAGWHPTSSDVKPLEDLWRTMQGN